MTPYLLFGLSILIAVAAYYISRARLPLATVAMIMLGIASGLLFSDQSSIWGLIFLVISCFQILNIARLIDGRLHAKYLRAAFFKGGLNLLSLQVFSLAIEKFLTDRDSLATVVSKAFLVTQAVVAIIILIVVSQRLIASRPKNVRTFLSDRELPTLSVLIPARNEDQNLEELLKTIVANDYPKLEVLVLDDSSTGNNISDIVRKFAHDGVRFIQGDIPKTNWLAKNQAYESLADQASGKWLIFIGVDVRLGVGSLRGLVHYAVNNDKKMLSVLPSRFDGAFWGGFFSPLRYFKELSKIGLHGKGAPVLSTAWLIEKETYRSLGGIEGVARKIIPEHYFAVQLAKNKLYGFIRTNDYLQVATAKKLKEQIDTSIRVIYPELHRRMERNALIVLFMFIYMFMPYVQLVNCVVNGQYGFIFIVSVIAVSCLTISHLLITTFTNPILWPLAIVNFPYLVLQEIVLGVVSMYRYEFGEVNWKGRNVCLPIMHVVPHLPPL